MTTVNCAGLTLWRITLLLLLSSCLPGCLHPGQPVVAERSPVFDVKGYGNTAGARREYTVRKGDTLYSIAWRFELDYLGLARANGVAEPYVIKPGQKMRLTTQLPKSQRAVRPATRKPAQVKAPVARPPPPAQWVWPLAQRPAVEYGKASKGMDFVIQTEAVVRAASAGHVVYAGNGLGGYERLVIIKHARDLLSAYSFDGRSRVNEQQKVKAGERVADIKNRGRTKQSLHFELRQDGEPINPRSVLQ